MITKPITSLADVLQTYWETGSKQQARDQEAAYIKECPGVRLDWSSRTQEWLDRYITNDLETLEVKSLCQKLQKVDDPVLIVGPTGTGKELLAQALHGPRQGKFVAINCTSLPDELLESELFGHIQGAFTGAIANRVGKFRSAFNGTLFLDEIGDMPMSFQAKLLRVLQEKRVCPIGSDKEEEINCRIVAATNKTIDELLDKGKFREDLYWRLSSFILQTKPLFDRPGDVIDIVDSLGGEKLGSAFHQQTDRTLSQFFCLKGNVRSLQAQVRRFLVTGKLQ